MSATPTFSGLRAVVLHRPDEGIEKLARQLRLLGLNVMVQWAALDPSMTPADLVLVDADRGFDELLPWPRGQAPLPIVALLGSEAPGRIAWALDQGATAMIAKPVVASAVYPALVMAARLHDERETVRLRIANLEERVRLRPLVHNAVNAIMHAQGMDEAAAYRSLRRVAMSRRLALEHVAAAIVAGREPLPGAG